MAGHSPPGFSGNVQNSWYHQLRQVAQVLKQQSSPWLTHHHHVSLLVWCSFSEMLCYFFLPHVMGCTPCKKFHFCFVSPQSIFPKGEMMGIIKMFCDKCEMGRSFWSAVVFAFELSLLHIVESLKWGLQCFIWCSGFFGGLLNELLMPSWSAFVRPLLGRFTTVPCFLHSFVDNGSHRCSLESQSLRNGFVTLFRLIDVNHFVSHLFLNFFGL